MPRYSEVFLYIYNSIKKNIRKVKVCDGVIYTTTFNYTNPLGVILYNNTIIINKCKKFNDYSNNTESKILNSFDSFVNVQNKLALEAIASTNSKKWFYNLESGTTYFSGYTPGSNGGTTSSGTYSIYRTNGTLAVSNTDYFILPAVETSVYSTCIYIINSAYKYNITFGNTFTGSVTCYVVGGSYLGINGNNLSGGGGGGGGGGVTIKNIPLSLNYTLTAELGLGGKGYNSTDGKVSSGNSSFLSGSSIEKIEGIGGGNGGNGQFKNITIFGGEGGIGGFSTNNGATGDITGSINNDESPTGSYGYNFDISVPNIYGCGGGGGSDFPYNITSNGGDGGFGCAGGGGAVCYDYGKYSEGHGGYGTTCNYSICTSNTGSAGDIATNCYYSAKNDTNGSYSKDKKLLTTGKGGNGFYGGGGAGSSTTDNSSGIKNDSNFGGDGGNGFVLLVF